MTIRTVWPMLWLVACASSRPETTDSNPAVAPALPAVASGPSAPLRLTLDASDVPGGTVLTATVYFDGRLPAGPTLRVVTPEGATLGEGKAEEVLALQEPATKAERRFVVKDRRGPVRVTADVRTPAFGAHAEASWPQEPRQPAAAPVMRPIAPVTVGGVTIDKAVPLSPAPASDGAKP